MNSPRNLDNAIATRASPLDGNPLLLSASAPSHRTLRSHKRRHHQSASNDRAAPTLSASIPLPKSHIHRTPSELQLADDLRRAEYEDVRMYARLVVGMQSRCLATGYVHPLTRKSLQDILRTKQAAPSELELRASASKLDALDDTGDDWGLCELEERDGCDSVDTPLPCHPLGTSSGTPTVVKTPSAGSLASDLSAVAPPEGRQGERDEDPQDEDECMFSLDL